MRNYKQRSQYSELIGSNKAIYEDIHSIRVGSWFVGSPCLDAKKRYINAIEVKGWNIPVTKEWTDLASQKTAFINAIEMQQDDSAMRLN